MFGDKKKKIKKYIEQLSPQNKTTFDLLCEDYINGLFKKQLEQIGLIKPIIHIDWTDQIKCIGIQAKYDVWHIDMQIYSDEFCLAADLDEADYDTCFKLENKEQFFNILCTLLKNL